MSRYQKFNIQVVEMNYLRGSCGVNRMECEVMQMYMEKFGIGDKERGMSCRGGEAQYTEIIWTPAKKV